MGRAMSQSSVRAIAESFQAGEITADEMVTAISEIDDYTKGKLVGSYEYERGSTDALVELWMADLLDVVQVGVILRRWDERGVDES